MENMVTQRKVNTIENNVIVCCICHKKQKTKKATPPAIPVCSNIVIDQPSR